MSLRIARAIGTALRGSSAKFVVRAALLMVAFYAVLYYPYSDGSFPARLLTRYLELVATISGATVSVFDPQVHVQGVFITGRQSLQIVLDCAALDALALFAATVLAFPASIRVKLTGLAAGALTISTFNVLRIVILYAAVMKSHDVFTFLHEDVMALFIVLVSIGCFAAWAVIASHHSARVEASASTPA